MAAQTSGKTMEGAVGPAGSGAEVLVVVPARSYLEQANRALEDHGLAGAPVTTVRELALQVLAAPESAGSLGQRRARVLLPAEEAFLFEDLKTLSIAPRRLREMLRFLDRGLTELREDDPDFVVMAEERLVLSTRSRMLDELGALEPSEVCALACRALEAEPLLARRLGADRVYVLGYSSLSLASQKMVALLARQSLCATGRIDDPGVTAEPYPNPAGFGALVDNDAGQAGEDLCGQSTLSIEVADEGNALPEPGRQLLNVAWDRPADEFVGLAAWVRARVDGGCNPASIALVAPNKPWGKRMAQALRDEGVACDELAALNPLPGDPHKAGGAPTLRQLALLGVAADELDPLPWRLLSGMGDALLGSVAWKGLRAYAQERDLGLASALLGLTGREPFPEAGRLAALVADTRARVADLRGLRGPRLLAALDPEHGQGGPGLARLVGTLQDGGTLTPGEDTDAAALWELARSRALDLAFFPGQASVRLGLANAFVGACPQIALVGGLVSGFTPDHSCFDERLDQERQARNLARQRVVFERTCRLGAQTLVLSRFANERLFDAEPARMEITRITATAQGRMAAVRPSVFLEEAESQGLVPRPQNSLIPGEE